MDPSSPSSMGTTELEPRPMSGDGGQSEFAPQRLREEATEQIHQASQRLRDQIDQRSTEYGQQLTAAGDAIRHASQELRDQGDERAALMTERGAQALTSVGHYLAESDSDRFLGDLEDFGRRRPMVLTLGGLALGFAAARFLKASSERRREEADWDTAPSTAPTYPATPGL